MFYRIRESFAGMKDAALSDVLRIMRSSELRVKRMLVSPYEPVVIRA